MTFTRVEVERLILAAALDAAVNGITDPQLVTNAVLRNIWPLVEALQEPV